MGLPTRVSMPIWILRLRSRISRLFFIGRMAGVREAIDVSQPGEYAWYLGNSQDTTLAPCGERHPVGEKMPNPGKNEMSIE